MYKDICENVFPRSRWLLGHGGSVVNDNEDTCQRSQRLHGHRVREVNDPLTQGKLFYFGKRKKKIKHDRMDLVDLWKRSQKIINLIEKKKLIFLYVFNSFPPFMTKDWIAPVNLGSSICSRCSLNKIDRNQIKYIPSIFEKDRHDRIDLSITKNDWFNWKSDYWIPNPGKK